MKRLSRIVSVLLAILMLLTSVSALAEAPAEGVETNNGCPYNTEKVKYDTRADKYLNGANLTVLPLADEPTAIEVWQGFSSTIVQGADESLVFQELEKRTSVKDENNIAITNDALPCMVNDLCGLTVTEYDCLRDVEY